MSFQKKFSYLAGVLQLAQDGDKDAQGYLKVEVGDVDKRSVPTPSIAKKDLEKDNMQKKINLVTYRVEAAKRLNMENILSVYRKEQGLLIELFQVLHGEMPTVVSRMKTTTIINMMRLLGQKNVSDGNTLVLMEEACKRALQEIHDDEESGLNYEPTEDSNEEESSEDEEEGLSTATAAKTPASAVKRPSSSAESAPAKRQKTGKSQDSSKRTEVPTEANRSSEDDEEEECSSAKSAPAPRNPAKRSHHKPKSCPIEGCKFNGNDLRRHLNVHVKKGDIEEQSVERLLSIVKSGSTQRAKPRRRKGKEPLTGRWKKWCPVPGCDQLIIDVARHLCNSTYHDFQKGSREVQRLVRMARRYTGLVELEDTLIQPPPPIVEESDPLEQPQTPVGVDSESDSDERSEGNTSIESDEEDEEASATPSQAGEVLSEGDEEEEHHSQQDEEDEVEEEEEDEEEDEGEENEGDEGDSDKDFKSQPRLIDYFTDPSPKSIRHRWLVKFYEFLSGPTAGDKKKSIRLQHVTQMRKLLEAIDPNGEDILCLLKDNGDSVWMPPPLHADDIAFFETVKEDLRGWRSTVDAKSHAEKNQRFVDESEGLLTLQELDQIKASKTYSEGRRVIIQAGKGAEPSLKDFLLARDFLLTRFSLDTGTRPGPLNNATIQEYEKGKVKDDCKVMLVARHKRAKDGPAICPMLPELYKFMEIYVRRLRPYFAKKDENALFITNEGEGFLEGTIGRRLTQFIAKCGVELGRRMAFVDMRKLITTEMLQRATPEEQAILRRVLAHSEKTSRDWYTRPDLTDLGVNAAFITQRLLNADDKAEHLSASSKMKDQTSPSPASSIKEAAGPSPSDQLPTTPTRPSPSKQNSIKDAAGTSSSVQPPATPRRPSPPPSETSEPGCASPAASTRSHVSTHGTSSKASTLVSGRVPPSPASKVLSDYQKKQIEYAFRAELAGNTPLTIEAAQRKMALNTVLGPLSNKSSRVKQVVNHVNYTIKKHTSTATLPAAEPPSDKITNWLDVYDDPSSRTSRRSEWDEQDTITLDRAFKSYNKLPSTATIRTTLRADTNLLIIFKREGWTRVYNKLKNLFKKKSKN
ncbi:hypothetical protein ACROYT_G015437 [Oculina patagonica]